MYDDPWSRRKAVKFIAVLDMLLAGFLISYAVVRLLRYDYKEQSVLYLLFREPQVELSLLYWVVEFGFLSLQIVIAFLLLTATVDMTTDPESMLKKCIWWRSLSILFSLLLSVEGLVILYEHFINDVHLKVLKAVLVCFELVFRGCGALFVGRFISDLKTLFQAPMTQYDNSGNPIPPSPAPITRSKHSHYFV